MRRLFSAGITLVVIYALLVVYASGMFASEASSKVRRLQEQSASNVSPSGMLPVRHQHSSTPGDLPTGQQLGDILSNLRDPLWIFPPDDRQRLTPADERVAFYFGIFDNGDGYWDDRDPGNACTATLIGARTLLTAAHCLYVHELGGWPTWFGVIPGLDGDRSPYGIVWGEWVSVPTGWVDTADYFFDFGLVILPASDQVGKVTGHLPLGALNDRSLSSYDLWATTIGYPADKPFGTQWIAIVQTIDDFSEDFFVSQLDQTHGQSGSAVFRLIDTAIFGIISFGVEVEGQRLNVSRRITAGVIEFALGVCEEVRCSFDYFIEPSASPPTPTPRPTETPPPTPTPQPTQPPSTPTQPPQPSPTPSEPPSQPPVTGDLTALYRTWERTDWPVLTGEVSRTWMWGPSGLTGVLTEAYAESPGGARQVQYYDKSRMEITDPAGDPNAIWYVTNGLLVSELITGRMQVGDDAFVDRAPADINVAGDPDDPTAPTYATFRTVLDAASLPPGTVITQFIDREGRIGSDSSLANYGVTADEFVPETNHRIASVFWDFMNSEGLVYENGQLVMADLFVNPFYATGFPITEPYWASVKVAGTYRWVLVQAFERRVLTYTTGNPPGFEVEAGNVGQHYYRWRYDS